MNVEIGKIKVMKLGDEMEDLNILQNGKEIEQIATNEYMGTFS